MSHWFRVKQRSLSTSPLGSLGKQSSVQGLSPQAMGGRTSKLSPKGQKVPSWSYLHGTDVVQLLCSYSRFYSSGTNNILTPEQDSLTERGAEGLLFLQGHPNIWLPHKELEKTLGSRVTEVPYTALVLMEMINSSKSTSKKNQVRINRTQIKVNEFPGGRVVPPILLHKRHTRDCHHYQFLPWDHQTSSVRCISGENTCPRLSGPSRPQGWAAESVNHC